MFVLDYCTCVHNYYDPYFDYFMKLVIWFYFKRGYEKKPVFIFPLLKNGESFQCLLIRNFFYESIKYQKGLFQFVQEINHLFSF